MSHSGRLPPPHPKGTFWVTMDRWGDVKLWIGEKPVRDSQTKHGPHQGTWYQNGKRNGCQTTMCERTFRLLTGIRLRKTTVFLWKMGRAAA